MIWLLPQESMIINGSDACDNWQSIITWFSSERYGSYTLYKGFAAVYPYVFLYHMAIALHLNEFFFCMLYFAVLFAYVTAIGVPLIAEYLTGWTPKLLQRIIVPVFFPDLETDNSDELPNGRSPFLRLFCYGHNLYIDHIRKTREKTVAVCALERPSDKSLR